MAKNEEINAHIDLKIRKRVQPNIILIKYCHFMLSQSHHSFISQNFVPDDKKDETYWERRKKNNDAARMSREAKRQKENQIIMRAAHLETKNSSLRSEIKNFDDQNDDIRTDVKSLQEKLATYEADNDSGFF